jgi:hypothetical protein
VSYTYGTEQESVCAHATTCTFVCVEVWPCSGNHRLFVHEVNLLEKRFACMVSILASTDDDDG